MKKNQNRLAKNAWAAAAALLALVALAASPLPPAWKYWRYSRAVELSPADATRLAGVVLAEEVYAQAKMPLVDLRMIDDRGAEIPYVLFMHEGSTNRVTLLTTLHEQSFAPGLYSQIVVEIGGQAPFHNLIQIQTNEPDFIEWVRVEASDDGHTWRIVQDRAPIFRFRNEGREGTQEIHYSENNARYLRLSILDGEKRFPVLGANVTYAVSAPSERAPLAAALSVEATPPAGESVWAADLGATHAPISEVRFEVPPPMEFSRSVDVDVSEDNEEWITMGRGEIYRFHQGDAMQEQLAITIPYTDPRNRYWRVTIENGNDSALSDAVAHFYTTPRHIVFEQQPGRSYRLLYGQSEAKPAEYDLGRRINAKERDAAAPGTLGPEEVNSDWSDPRPWTERFDFVLWFLLGLAVLILGVSAIRSLRRSAAAPSE
jgi:hypothetical protein